MKISVDKKHIANGVVANSQHCMIADAIKDRIPSAQYISVDLQTIRWTDPAKGTRFMYLTPATAQCNLLKFDQGKRVDPFSFSLTTPAKTRSVDSRPRKEVVAKRKKTSKAHRAKYAYLAANRERNRQKEREFGLRKFTEKAS